MTHLPPELAERLHAGPLDRREVRALHVAPDVLEAILAEIPKGEPLPAWKPPSAVDLSSRVDLYLDEALPAGGWRFESPEQWRERIDAAARQHLAVDTTSVEGDHEHGFTWACTCGASEAGFDGERDAWVAAQEHERVANR